MTPQQLIYGIKSKLTGNVQADISFLKREALYFKKHKYANEILLFIRNTMFEMLQMQHRTELIPLVKIKYAQIQKNLDNANLNMQNSNLQEAEKLLEKLYEYKDEHTSNDKYDYYYFNTDFELQLFLHLYKPEKQIKSKPVFYKDIIHLYGYVLIENGKPDKAEEVFKKGLSICPMEVNFLNELSEIAKLKKDLDKIKYYTAKIYEVTYNPDGLGLYYRKCGYYFTETGNKEASVSCYLKSLSYENSELLVNELSYIEQTLGTIEIDMIRENLEKILVENGIPLKPNIEIMNLSVKLAEDCIKNRHYDHAFGYYKFAYDLFGDNSLIEKSNTLKYKLEHNLI